MPRQEGDTNTYICVYFGAAYLALILTPLVIRLARRVGAVDHPGTRSVHDRPIPRIGGVAIYLSAMCLIVSLLFLPNAIGDRFREVRLQVVTLLCSVTCIFLVGLIDDLRGLPARFKFVAELLGAGALCLVGVRISSIGLGEGSEIFLGWLGCPITLLWIVGVTNAVNMSDGLDGLAAGVAAIACGVIAVLAIYGSTIHTGLAQTNDMMMALFSLALLGGLSGFLFFNFNPAKVFMGDCGSLFIGFTIASASVMCISKSAALVGLALPALALGIPIFDTLFSMLRRFLERRSLFAPDRSHFHHRLLELGLNQRRAVIMIYLVTLLATGLGLFMLVGSMASSLMVFAGVVFSILLLFRVVGVIRPHQTLRCLQERHRYACQQRHEQEIFEQLELQFRRTLDPDQWWQAVCEAAGRMDFAWVSLKTTYADGRTQEELWRAPGDQPSLSKIITITIPVGNGDDPNGVSRQFEIAIWRNGSLESASRRGMLFGRLLDESELTALPVAPATDKTQSQAKPPGSQRVECQNSSLFAALCLCVNRSWLRSRAGPCKPPRIRVGTTRCQSAARATSDSPCRRPLDQHMRKHDQGAPDPSCLQLVLCALAVCGGAAAAAYLYWTVHWVAAVVITVYLWILLTDVCMTGRQSVTWYLLDFLHHLLSFTGTALIAAYLWSMDWRIGTIAILPVFILLLAATGFLILRLYGMTPDGRATEDARRQMHEQPQMSRL